jgi:sialate O-acetylesterase
MKLSLSALLMSLAVLATTSLAGADPIGSTDHPFLSLLFADNMVLQRARPIPVFGWTSPGANVTVRLKGATAKATAGTDGHWQAELPAMRAGGPYELVVSGPQTVTLKNVLIGDVWICSGQSNMEFGIGNANDAAQEIAAANDPQIRLFTVRKVIATEPQPSLAGPFPDLMGQWSVCTPQTVATGGWNGFSAVGYFFGRELQHTLHVPIGLIHTSWGGTPAEAWTSAEALSAIPDYAPALADLPRRRTETPSHTDQNFPTVLYNGMIAPLIPYGIKGAIWYQGESNAGKAYQYRTLLPTMIEDWRHRWNEGDFPFLIVQLANFQKHNEQPVDDAWAELREAQSLTAKHLKNCGIAVTIDIGNADDIHPKDKQDVGKRLALVALNRTYGDRVEYSGPEYAGMKRDGAAIRLRFTHTDGQLVAKGGDKLEGFAIAGADKKFVWADARIEGDSIIVSSSQVPDPVAVRYAWSINPVCNLYNKADLPASPFRTDDWPPITLNNK